jgi:transposase-like protein
LATGDFRPALEALPGADAAGLSPANIRRLTASWEQDYQALRQRDLTGRKYACVWADGHGHPGAGSRRWHAGILGAAREVWPESREQGCWCQKLVNVLGMLPPRLQPRAKPALHEMMYAASRPECAAARTRFADEYQVKYPKAAESLVANWERLTAFFRFTGRALEAPAQH